MQRALSLDRLRSGAERFDLAIIGGGASGLGAAVEAASRGHRVALIEQADFAKGTSGRSTKLVHGGVRYLRQGNLALVLQALEERGRLARNAPHLVHDLAFVIPAYGWWEKPFYGAGMKVYDRLAGRWRMGRSRGLSRRETVELIPTVAAAGLRGGVVYHDGQFDDARLAVNLARTAVDLGAALANYCACVGLVKEQGRIAGVLARDGPTGGEFSIRARTVINATGVFVDAVRRHDDPASAALIAVSQGIHLVLPKVFLPGRAALMIPRTRDGRVLFAVPWHDRVIVGTTDTPGLAPSLEPRALPEETDFVLEHARLHLSRGPRPEEVLSVYAGLRPLVQKGHGGSTAALSRDHTLVVSASGLVTLTGGKWTTYRRMGSDAVDCAESVGGLARRASRTKDLRIHGWTLDAIADPALQAYGSDAREVGALIAAEPGLSALLHPRLPFRQGEVVWHARQEMALTVEDVLARRTRALLLDARAAIEAAPVAARLLARELGRGEAWITGQVAEFTALARGYVFGEAAAVAHRDAPPSPAAVR